jgi:hypothetical protein
MIEEQEVYEDDSYEDFVSDHYESLKEEFGKELMELDGMLYDDSYIGTVVETESDQFKEFCKDAYNNYISLTHDESDLIKWRQQ